ncbi:hypothetical protein [Rhizobium sp. CC-YZS058]|uniref:hypothetical protein n=1 Tax=Rhizobium sp. CC-YZS058 TaxID=3042153 RepID=UPI002B05A3AB|nr:hypothetical protein [Rhizobium sp. CC-YZS058]MEA3533340.1 hypothetical protein [Rhizobium sp. CC-YZS058]
MSNLSPSAGAPRGRLPAARPVFASRYLAKAYRTPPAGPQCRPGLRDDSPGRT